MIEELTVIQRIAISALPVIFAITVHEAAHGYAARYFGDFTADQAGRITLNPLKHIDPLGTLLLPAITIMLGGVLFGWAKPVPVNFGRLRRPKKDMLWVAAAGPIANFVMAIFWVLLLMVAPSFTDFVTEPLMLMAKAGVMINVILMVLNLLPLPPLDGGRIAVSLLPTKLARTFAKIEPYGFMILMLLLFTHTLGMILWPMVIAVLTVLSEVFGVSIQFLLQ